MYLELSHLNVPVIASTTACELDTIVQQSVQEKASARERERERERKRGRGATALVSRQAWIYLSSLFLCTIDYIHTRAGLLLAYSVSVVQWHSHTFLWDASCTNWRSKLRLREDYKEFITSESITADRTRSN